MSLVDVPCPSRSEWAADRMAQPGDRAAVYEFRRTESVPDVYGLDVVQRRGGLWYEVHVLPTVAELKEYARTVYEREKWYWAHDTFDALALVHAEFRPRKDNAFAVLFISEERCGTRVLSHECVHVALAYMRAGGMSLPRASTGIDDREEALCYLVGDIMAGIVGTLREYGHME